MTLPNSDTIFCCWVYTNQPRAMSQMMENRIVVIMAKTLVISLPLPELPEFELMVAPLLALIVTCSWAIEESVADSSFKFADKFGMESFDVFISFFSWFVVLTY